MPRYFFHVKQGTETITDEEGIELADLDAVREEALKSSREILSELALKGDAGTDRALVVSNEVGDTVLTYPLALALSSG